MSAPVRIVVADDHNLFRAGLIELLESVKEFTVLADVASGPAAITAAGDLKPDILILDIEMPGPGPIAVMEAVSEVSAETKVVVLTMHDDPVLVRSLFEAGAAAYLVKSAGRNELMAAVNSAARAEGSILLAVSRATAIGLGRGPQHTGGDLLSQREFEVVSLVEKADRRPCAADRDLLSQREFEVVSLVAEAKTNREIARKLFISEATVKRHLANVYNKLGASSRMEAVHLAVARGILADDAAPGRPKRR